MNVLMLSPEPPYPLQSGGACRTASLLHYFAQYAEVDLILLSEGGQPAVLPPGLVRSQDVITLPVHRKTLAARYLRNARRAIAGIPPLVDRFAGLENQIARTVANRHYDLAVIEHFWCAPYVETIGNACASTVLDLHNVESVLHRRCAEVSDGLMKLGHSRFTAASRNLEVSLLPRFSMVLAASDSDARTVHAIAPDARVTVYPNSLPLVPVPVLNERYMVVFSANFEYHPNIDATRFLLNDIWPEVHRRHPDLILRLVGRGDRSIRHLLSAGQGIETSGPIPDALAEIAQASIVIAPLRAGSGTRIKILEAWAAARPVIATPLAAEGLSATDGENILLARDGPAFANAIDALLADESARRRLGAGGRRTFEDFYSWNAAWIKLDLDAQLMRNSGLKRYTGTSDAIRR